VKGGMLAAGMFTARRAAWPTLVASTVVTSALWFGIFEITLSLSKFVLPAPKESSSRGQVLGVATVPVTLGSSLWAAWRLCPTLPVMPEKILDVPGWKNYISRLPGPYLRNVCVGSATLSAVTCRVVQYRNGS